ncbi:MAG: 30S ribosomal protein S19 [Methanohalobium sp.]|uniref:30S ribosomal protein S19 n=1 Tax=Methanohalobium sp. TaxID=2837493 RepID=UPI00397B07D4
MAKKSSTRVPKRKGEFKFRGKTLEELKELTIEEFAELLPASQRRSIRRGFTENQKKILQQYRNGDDNVRTHDRSMVILPEMVNKNIEVYNGTRFVKIQIVPEMLGHRIGEFAMSRGVVKHGSAGVGATRSSKFVPLK